MSARKIQGSFQLRDSLYLEAALEVSTIMHLGAHLSRYHLANVCSPLDSA
jgi:hypothetical protein